MTRKNILDGLMKGSAGDPPAPARPRRETGAIGAVSQSLTDLRNRALIEVPADMIDDAGIRDRLDADPAGHAALTRSIEAYGQQVPVLLRHSPNVEGRYEVVYGRRRVAALKALKRPVRAMLRDLDDRSLIVAQGQENAARKDLTFIEKARFAGRMVDMGFERSVICDALHLDKTVISRMLSVVDAVPVQVITAIGAAPAAGRDRWLALSRRIGDRTPSDVAALALGETSDDRFRAVFEALTEARPATTDAATSRTLSDPTTGVVLGHISQRRGKPVLTLEQADGFDAWLADNISDLHRRFREAKDLDPAPEAPEQ